jgi:NitT/TauT family transport system substrate-binding protein
MPALLTVANERELFAREKLAVTIQSFPLGTNALDELFAGKCDVATLAETPVAIRSFERDDFRVVASLRSIDDIGRIVARRDKGVQTIADLKGRRIGIPKGTVPHYFLDMVLAKHGLKVNDITPVFVEPDKLLPNLVNGAVDAIATVNTMALRATEKLGEKAVVFKDPGLCLNYSLLVVRKDFADRYPLRIQRLLSAFTAAERLSSQEPELKRKIIINSQKLSEADYDAVWKPYNDRLLLDNALLLTLEENARWVLEKGLVKGVQIPNFLVLIDIDPLRKVAPEAVRLQR